MTTTPQGSEEAAPAPGRVRILLSRGSCTTLEETAKLLYEAITDALEQLRNEPQGATAFASRSLIDLPPRRT